MDAVSYLSNWVNTYRKNVLSQTEERLLTVLIQIVQWISNIKYKSHSSHDLSCQLMEGCYTSAMKKKLLLLPLAVILVNGGLTSCTFGTNNNEKVYLSFRRTISFDTLADSYDEPTILFHHFDEKVEKNGVTTMEKRYIANEMEVQAMLDKKASFIVAAVPDFTCLCWKNFVKDNLSIFITENNADVYVVDSKTVLKNESWGINTSGNDPVIAIMSNGKAAYQTAIKDGGELAKDRKKLSAWITDRANFTSLYWVGEEKEVDSLMDSPNSVIYFGRSSCSDCTYFETNFLFDYFKDPNMRLQYPVYYVDCDVEGRRFKNGEYDEGQWKAYKASHHLAETENNKAGYGEGYVPTLMQISSSKTVDAMDVYLNDTVKKNEEGHYVVEKSYFTEARKENHYLDYIKNYTPLEGLDLGTCEEEGVKAYYWYREKLAAYHNAYAKDFLDSMTIKIMPAATLA